MEIGMIGLGRMGSSMTRRLLGAGHRCTVYDLHPESVQTLVKQGATGAVSLKDLAQDLSKPCTLWLMVPAAAVDPLLGQLVPLLDRGDIVIDGGNSYYLDDLRRAADLKQKGIHYLDDGTSGGVWGAERGYCLMIGGEEEPVMRLDPIFAALAPGIDAAPRTPGRNKKGGTAELGYLHCGPNGAGHFAKMVHNGIEYGIMAAYAEGLNVLRHANIGSVIASRLLDLAATALLKNPDLANFAGRVSDSGEGRWTIEAAIDEAVPVPVLSTALYERFSSRAEDEFADKVLSALRYEFGGHQEKAAAAGGTR